jgi:hypothetical protein
MAPVSHAAIPLARLEDKWDDYFGSYARAAGFTEARNPAGVRAFEQHKKQGSKGTSP